MNGRDALEDLSWLLDAGADEAIGEEPVDRIAIKSPSPLVGEGGASSASEMRRVRGEPQKPLTRPPQAAPATGDLSHKGRGEDSIATAMELAASCNTLAELKAALESFEGCPLKKGATNTVFADGNAVA